jgi:acylphosphatase
MKQHFDYIIHGFVQGVGFRYFVYKIAVELNIQGFAKNNFDGTVCVTAEGEESDLECFTKELAIGPSRSRVDKVEKFLSGFTGLFTGFEIK